MTDLSHMTLAEIEGLVAAEKARRKADAIAQLEAIAQRHGFKLSDLFPHQRLNAKSGVPYGKWPELIAPLLKSGKTVNEILAELGKNGKAAPYVYRIAKARGFKISDGVIQ